MRKWMLLGLLSFGLPLYGQQATARILGTVFDPSSATIAGAAVTVNQRCDLSTKVCADFVFGRVLDSLSTDW